MIRKKLIILGSVLLLIGGIMLGWILAEKEKLQREASQYHLKYGVDTDDYVKQYEEWLQASPRERPELPPILEDNGKAMTREQLWQEQQERLKADLHKLATGKITVHPLADVLYGDNWQNELNEYKKQNELNEQIMTGSIVCTSMGGSIYAGFFLLWATRFMIRCSSGLRLLIAKRRGDIKGDIKTVKDKDKKPVTADIADTKALKQEQQKKKPNEKQNRPEKLVNVFDNSGLQSPVIAKSGAKTLGGAANKAKVSNGTETINKLLTDEKNASVKAVKTPAKWGKKSSDTAEPSNEPSKPLDSAITELTQQVSAIREYAACQQDRLEKLQDGYDWNIVRTFCLRVIRCIDNLESRISRLGKEDVRATHLEEIRDELIFALESSGIEQFEPEINSEYRGQEKFAEAVKDKQQSEESNQAGTIAKVIRPGYQYFINEENVKVVRPAQVKLYA
ncbi:MAG: nucleotide exchange factor GrpE [Planctomycetota bacterium]|jgi:molecular chaperone GrpE (heat shock protein)